MSECVWLVKGCLDLSGWLVVTGNVVYEICLRLGFQSFAIDSAKCKLRGFQGIFIMLSCMEVILFSCPFLVADTHLYKRLCLSICWYVSVHTSKSRKTSILKAFCECVCVERGGWVKH